MLMLSVFPWPQVSMFAWCVVSLVVTKLLLSLVAPFLFATFHLETNFFGSLFIHSTLYSHFFI
jgi:hypothetical protein